MNNFQLTIASKGMLCAFLLAPLSMWAQSEAKPGVQGTLVLQSGEASTFELPLGDVGKGPDQQDMALFQFNNLFSKNDGLVVYGWQTTDMNGIVNWSATAFYKRPVLLHVGGGTVLASTGVQRLHLPLVAKTDDWVSDNAIYYERPGRFPINFQADSKTVVSSNRELAMGSFLVLNVTTSSALWKRGGSSLSLRHGPLFVEGMGMYGVHGARAFRYEAALVASHRGYNFEFLAAPQVGLQSDIDNSTYWAFSVSKAFHLFGPHE